MKIPGKRDQQQTVDASFGDPGDLFFAGGDQVKGLPFGVHHPLGMGLKGDHDGLAFFLPGLPEHLMENVLMPPVYAVKVPDGDDGPPEVIGYLVETVENIHDYCTFALSRP